MSRFYNDLTGEILDYPDEAAALFPALKRVPSEKAKEAEAKPVVDETPKPKENQNAK